MYQDVEIIEEDRQIIEISDDDCLLKEDIKSYIEIIDCVSPEYVPVDANKDSSLNAEINCILLEDETTQPNNNSIDSNVEIAYKSEINETNQNCSLNTNIAYSSLEGNVAATSNCSEAIPKNAPSRKKKRKRRRKTIKNLQQFNKVRKTAVEKEITPSSIIDQNENNNSPVAFTATCSSNAVTPSCITNNHASYSDFSKLKWLKPLRSLSTPPHLQIVIIDRSHPFWRIDNDKWLMIEKRLLEALNTEMIQSNDASIGLFEGAKWQRGIKILGCLNKNTFNFIKNFVINLDNLWGGAKLDAFSISDINVHMVKGYIPLPKLKTDMIMSLIKLQNPSICTNDWVIIREQENLHKGGIDIWIRVNDKSFTQLRERKGELKFGINRIWFNPWR